MSGMTSHGGSSSYLQGMRGCLPRSYTPLQMNVVHLHLSLIMQLREPYVSRVFNRGGGLQLVLYLSLQVQGVHLDS